MSTNELARIEEPEFQALVRDTYCKGATELEFRLFIEQARTLNLNPVAGQICLIKMWDAKLGREVATPVVRIDGFRAVAHRTGQFAGRIGPEWCGTDGVWKDVWLEKGPPAAARVGVLRKDCQSPIWGTALYKSFCRTKKDGQPMALWATMPELLLGKCAEAQALRAAFPLDLGGLYVDDEMEQAQNVEHTKAEVVEPLKLPEAACWEANKETLKWLQAQIESAGVPFSAENRAIFTKAKEALIGVPIAEVDTKIVEIIEDLCFNKRDVPAANDKPTGTETTTQA
jgi:phage recombination protein Bet